LSAGLIVEHAPVADMAAVTTWERYGRRYELDELVGEARLVLVEAAESWDAGAGVPFAAYVRQQVRWRLIDLIRHVSGRVRYDEDGRVRWRRPEAVSLGDPVPGSDGSTHEETVPAAGAAPDAALYEAERAAMARALLALLHGRERLVIERAVMGGEKHVAIAADLGCHYSRISQIQSAALRKLRRIALELYPDLCRLSFVRHTRDGKPPPLHLPTPKRSLGLSFRQRKTLNAPPRS
jgi:RNA polymerase sigma factor (sigma-70 family)